MPSVRACVCACVRVCVKPPLVAPRPLHSPPQRSLNVTSTRELEFCATEEAAEPHKAARCPEMRDSPVITQTAEGEGPESAAF